MAICTTGLPGVTIDDLLHDPNADGHIFEVFTLAQRWLDAVAKDGL